LYISQVPKQAVQRLINREEADCEFYSDEQLRAAKLMLLCGPAKTINFVVGGPSTGKSWTVALALKFFLENRTNTDIQ
jgi:hypothetical protein